MYSDIIGIVGGMGSYATVDFFKRLVDSFPAEKEWDRPRIIIDNNCVMPSRVKIIIDEMNTGVISKDRAVLIQALSNSISHLADAGCTKIVLACNTSHVYLPDVKSALNYGVNNSYELLNIIEITAQKLKESGVISTLLIATEGTIYSNVYVNIFNKYGIHVNNIPENRLSEVRYFIECVKQNQITETDKEKFVEFISSFSCPNVILGCTELPILFSYTRDMLLNTGIQIHDPLTYTIEYLQKNIT